MGNGALSLSIAKSALQAQQLALDTTSQNLANANTPGYARKVARLEAMASSGTNVQTQVGTGVQMAQIEAVRDLFLNGRIRQVQSDLGDATKTEQYLERIELLLTGENDLGKLSDNFFSSLQDLAAAPESLTVRAVVRESGRSLADGVARVDGELSELQTNVDREIEGRVSRINEIGSTLADLNDKIANMTGAGLAPNDFIDQREVLLEELSKLVDVSVVNGTSGTISVLAGSQTIVQGTQSFAVSAVADATNDLHLRVQAAGTPGGDLLIRSGELEGLLGVRDETIDGVRAHLDEFALSIAERTNAIHRTGFGLDGTTGNDFFQPFGSDVGETRVSRVASTTFVDRTDLPLNGDATTALAENFEANPIAANSFVLNGVSISYAPATDSLQNIVDRVNASRANATAYLTPENRLVIAGSREANYEIQNLRDNGTLLGRLGILPTGSTYPPSSGVPASVFSGTVTLLPPQTGIAARLRVSDDVEGDLRKIAAARGDDTSIPPDGVGDLSQGPGDGGNALLLAALQGTEILSKNTATATDFLTSVIGEVGASRAAAKREVESRQDQVDALEAVRSSVQGVSIDEELINLIKYQRGFQAAARIINVTDQVLQTLLGLGA